MITTNIIILTGMLCGTLLTITFLTIRYKMTMLTFLTISAVFLFTAILAALFAGNKLGINVEGPYKDLFNIMLGSFLTYFNLIVRHHVQGSTDKRDVNIRTRKTDVKNNNSTIKPGQTRAIQSHQTSVTKPETKI